MSDLKLILLSSRFDITRGLDNAGELLAAFELLELGSNDLPKLTEPKFLAIEFKNGDCKGLLLLFLRKLILPLSRFYFRSTQCSPNRNDSTRATRCSPASGQIPSGGAVLGSERFETSALHDRGQAPHWCWMFWEDPELQYYSKCEKESEFR